MKMDKNYNLVRSCARKLDFNGKKTQYENFQIWGSQIFPSTYKKLSLCVIDALLAHGP